MLKKYERYKKSSSFAYNVLKNDNNKKEKNIYISFYLVNMLK